MTTDQPSLEEPAATDERPRLLSVEVGDWAGLSGNVRLELDGSRTVLVGKNGAGKSLLIEGLFWAARSVSGVRFGQPAPLYFRCTVGRGTAPPLAYEYRLRAAEADEENDASAIDVPARVTSWTERCWTPDDGTEVWRVVDAKLVVRQGPTVPLLPGMGLHAAPEMLAEVPAEAAQIGRILAGFGMVPAGVPREGTSRQEILVSSKGRNEGGRRRWSQGGRRGRAGALAYAITSMWDNRREDYDEFVDVLRGLGLVREVTVKIYADPQTNQSTDERRDFASVLFDGVNIGLQSDGTQRIADIVRLLLRRNITCLLIEEPETAVHPGLLSKLLALMDSYGYGRQIVVSTHSPQVVDWCEPEQLRLVERREGKTQVHSLSREDLDRVRRYLHEEGTFADFVYARADA
jgi:predicted ATPase